MELKAVNSQPKRYLPNTKTLVIRQSFCEQFCKICSRDALKQPSSICREIFQTAFKRKRFF